ncbi:cytochrome P450 [Micromonospora arborensis]|uniref:cytochrome P450 n=1 Tax=Micromonospora arborensis TaxID=2116518 RepID=UPI00342D37BF
MVDVYDLSAASNSTDLLRLLPPLAEIGDSVRYSYGKTERILLNDPEEIAAVVGDPRKEFGGIGLLQRVMGEGLLVATDLARWKPRRRVVQRELSPRQAEKFADGVIRSTRQMIGRWGPGRQISVRDEIEALALSNLGDAVFGGDFGQWRELVRKTLEQTLGALDSLEAGTPDVEAEERLEHTIVELEHAIREMVGRRADQVLEPQCVLDVLIQASKSGESLFADPFVRDEAITMMIAGYDTTAFIISVAVFLISRHPQVRDRLATEMRAARAAGVSAERMARELPYARMVASEVLRLYPPIAIFHRPTFEAREVCGGWVEKGTILTASSWVTHRSPRFFKDPLVFDPERFSPERRQEIPRHSYFPFGLGQRACAGNHFAMLTIALVIATIAADVELEFLDEEPVIAASVTLRLDNAMPAIVKAC